MQLRLEIQHRRKLPFCEALIYTNLRRRQPTGGGSGRCFCTAQETSVVSGFLSLLSFADKLTVRLAANETQAISFSPLSQARRWLLLTLTPPPSIEEIKQGKQTTKPNLNPPQHLQPAFLRLVLSLGIELQWNILSSELLGAPTHTGCSHPKSSTGL